jgi:hypothetical protein
MRRRTAVLAGFLLLLAGCGSPAPPTAKSLAARIPGCTPRFFSNGISPDATQEVTCRRDGLAGHVQNQLTGA